MMETGVFYDWPESEYRKCDALNASTLKVFRKTPAHVLNYLTQPPAPSKAQTLGTAVHLSLLEHDRYLQDVRIGPANDRRTKAWQEWDQVTLSPLKITPEEAVTVDHIYKSIRNKMSGTALKLLTGKGENEVSVVWCDVATGQHCKARADRITRYEKAPCIVELKTARDARPKEFGYACRDFGYDLSAAWYLRGFGLMLPEIPERLIFVVVETEAPFAVAVYELTDAVLQRAFSDCEKYLQQYVACTQTRSWPGFADNIVQLTI